MSDEDYEWQKALTADMQIDKSIVLVEFVSTKNRPRPREVSLVRCKKYSLQVVRGELKSSRKKKADELAEEVLGSGCTPDDLLHHLRRRS